MSEKDMLVDFDYGEDVLEGSTKPEYKGLSRRQKKLIEALELRYLKGEVVERSFYDYNALVREAIEAVINDNLSKSQIDFLKRLGIDYTEEG